MNKFIFAVQDFEGQIFFGLIKSQAGRTVKEELRIRYPKAYNINIIGYTGDERTEELKLTEIIKTSR